MRSQPDHRSAGVIGRDAAVQRVAAARRASPERMVAREATICPSNLDVDIAMSPVARTTNAAGRFGPGGVVQFVL